MRKKAPWQKLPQPAPESKPHTHDFAALKAVLHYRPQPAARLGAFIADTCQAPKCGCKPCSSSLSLSGCSYGGMI